MEDYAAILKDLINTQKKSSPSLTNKNKFHDSWLNLAKLEGFTERAEKYLYDGLNFCGAATLKEYLAQADKPEEELAKFFSGTLYSANKAGAFRLVINLIALYLNDGDKPQRISALLSEIPKISRNKDGKIWGNANKIFAKYFLDALNADAKLVPLSTLNVSPKILEDFTKMLADAIQGVKSPSAAKVKAWLGNFIPPAKTPRLSKKLLDVAKQLETLENECDSLSDENFRLNQSLADEHGKLEAARQTLSALNQNIADAKAELSAKEKLLADKDAELDDKSRLIEVLQNEQARNAEVALNKIASGLKTEYQDFQSALEAKMTCELGENFRQQLKNIFRTLERHGLNFK